MSEPFKHTGAYAGAEKWSVTEHGAIVGMFVVYVTWNRRGHYTARWVHESARGAKYPYELPQKFATEYEAKVAVVQSTLKARREKPWKVPCPYKQGDPGCNCEATNQRCIREINPS